MPSLSMVKVSMQSILDKLNTSIHFLQPLYESIVNAIEADATDITIVFYKDKTLDEQEYKPKITGFKITDNGIGFVKENRNSFAEFWSKYKVQLGCKGIGRFTWLKVFSNIKIESFTKTEKVTIDFDENFSENAIQVVPHKTADTQTTITLLDVTNRYYDNTKDLRVNADLKEIKYAIENHLMVNFFLWKKEKNKSFKIKLQIDKNIETIDSDNLLQLKQETFSVKEELNNTDVKFDLYYNFIEDHKNRHTLFYCADGRTVLQFPEDIRFKNFTDNSSSIFLLTSKYFDERINDARNEFTFDFKENNPSLSTPLPMPKINTELKSRVDNILIHRYPNLKEENINILNACIDENPHLAKYIRKANIGLIPDKQTLLKKANSEFKAEKEKVKNDFIKMLSSNEIDTNDFQENISHLNDMCNRELAQYFYYRQNIINALNKLNKEKNKKEKLLHNLFMSMRTISDRTDSESSIYNTNIWLLDDKYMSYTKMFSAIKIKAIKEHIVKDHGSESSSLKEPDLTIFYNENGSEKDVVVVELKAIGSTTDKKIVSIPEINRNLGIIAKEIDNIKTLYGYIITHLDDATKESLLLQQGMFELFATGNESIFYYYNSNIKDKDGKPKPCHIYILSTETLYQDANARNKVFLDIVKNTN